MFNLIAVNTNPWAQGSKTHVFAFVWGALERVKGVVFQAYFTDKEGKSSTAQGVLHDCGVRD